MGNNEDRKSNDDNSAASNPKHKRKKRLIDQRDIDLTEALPISSRVILN
jgi:hypothetical protein